MAQVKVYPIKSHIVIDTEELQQDDSIVIGFRYATATGSTGEILLQSRLPELIDCLHQALDDLNTIHAKRRSQSQN